MAILVLVDAQDQTCSDIVKFAGWISLWENWGTDFPARNKDRARRSGEPREAFNGAAIVWFRQEANSLSRVSRIVAFFDMRGRERVWDVLEWKPVKGA